MVSMEGKTNQSCGRCPIRNVISTLNYFSCSCRCLRRMTNEVHSSRMQQCTEGGYVTTISLHILFSCSHYQWSVVLLNLCSVLSGQYYIKMCLAFTHIWISMELRENPFRESLDHEWANSLTRIAAEEINRRGKLQNCIMKTAVLRFGCGSAKRWSSLQRQYLEHIPVMQYIVYLRNRYHFSSKWFWKQMKNVLSHWP